MKTIKSLFDKNDKNPFKEVIALLNFTCYFR